MLPWGRRMIACMSALLDELLAVPEETIASWDEGARQWYEQTLHREIALRSPADFAVAHSGGMWQAHPHLVYTSDAIVDMIEHDTCDILIVEEPVRHGKSELCSKWTPAWFQARFGGRKRVLLASYEAEFARGWGRKVRDIISEIGAGYGLTRKSDVWTQENWELEQGGGMATAGANGPITGKGGHLLICDDPIKTKKEADSPTFRKDLWEWWDSVWLTRRQPEGTKFILIMSRWHADDIIGRLKKLDDYGLRIRVLHLPALAEDDDEMGRRPGEALCPALYDEQSLSNIRRTSPLAWPALYQQRPVTLGGGLFKRENFESFRLEKVGDDTAIRTDHGIYDLNECLVFGTMDTAYTRNKRSDYTALGIFAVPPPKDGISEMFVLDMYRVRVEAAEHAPLALKAWHDHKPRWIGLEKINASMSLFSEAQRQGVVMRWLNPDGNKIARAETAVALSEQGRIYVPDEAEWLDDYLEELCTFPSAQHDDMVDVTSYAAGEVVKRAVRGRHKKEVAQTPDETIWAKVQQMNKRSFTDDVLGKWKGG